MTCWRCNGRVLRDRAGDSACINCGLEVHSAAEIERGQRFQAWDNTRGPRARRGSLPNFHLPSEWARG